MKNIILTIVLMLSLPVVANTWGGANGAGSNGVIRCELGDKIEYVPPHICEMKKMQKEKKD